MKDLDYTIIDPEGRYRTGATRDFERLALTVSRWRSPFVVDRVRDAIEVRFPTGIEDEADLVVLLTPEAIELRLPTIDWTQGAYGPAASSELWKRVVWSEEAGGDLRALSLVENGAAEAKIHEYLEALASAFKGQVQTCVHCEETFLPARMTDSACHGCAEKIEGVVF